MNIKVDRCSSLHEAVDYNFEKSQQTFLQLSKKEPKKYLAVSSNVSNDQMVAEVIASFSRLMSTDIEVAKKTLKASTECHYNPNAVKNKYSHFKVSFPPEEKLDNLKMKFIGLDILKGLEYVDTPYLIFRHYDEPHPHFHIVTSTIKINGSTVPSSFEGIRSKYLEREIEDKYSLIKKADRIKEFKGTKGKTWKEVQLVNKSKVESFSHVIRRSFTSYSKNEPPSLESFARAISRDGLRLKFDKFEREWEGKKRVSYGISYALENSKVNFKFSDNVKFLKDDYSGFKMPQGAEDAIKGQKKTTFIAINDEGKKLDVVVSRNHFNGIYLTNEDIIHPELPESGVITKNGKSYVPAIKGSKVGSKFSYYGLQDQIGFSDLDADKYIEQGNDNILHESPEMTKLLYSAVREYKDGIKEALDEGAKIEEIASIDWEFLTQSQQKQLILTVEQHIKEEDKNLTKDNFKASIALAIYEENYIIPSTSTIDLARAFENKDWDAFYKALDENNESLADTRVIPDLKWVTEQEGPRNYIKATFERKDELVKDLAKSRPEMAKKSDRASAYATLALAMALDNKDRDVVLDLVSGDNINYQDLNIGRNNTHWLDKAANEFLFYRANDNNIDEANKKLNLNGYPKIGEETAKNINESSTFEGRYVVREDLKLKNESKQIDQRKKNI